MLRGFTAIRRAVPKRRFAAFLVVAVVTTVLGTSGTAQNSPPPARNARRLTDELIGSHRLALLPGGWQA
jgi:hypothetical protein